MLEEENEKWDMYKVSWGEFLKDDGFQLIQLIKIRTPFCIFVSKYGIKPRTKLESYVPYAETVFC